MKTFSLAIAAVLAMIMVPSIAHAQVQYACPTQTCPNGQMPVPVQSQQLQPQVTQVPPPVVSQPPVVVQNTTQPIDPALLKIILGLQSQLNNLQNQIIALKTAPPPMNNSTPPPPPPPPDNGGGSCPSNSGSSCPNGGPGGPPPYAFYQGPGFQGFFRGGGHFGGGHHGR